MGISAIARTIGKICERLRVKMCRTLLNIAYSSDHFIHKMPGSEQSRTIFIVTSSRRNSIQRLFSRQAVLSVLPDCDLLFNNLTNRRTLRFALSRLTFIGIFLRLNFIPLSLNRLDRFDRRALENRTADILLSRILTGFRRLSPSLIQLQWLPRLASCMSLLAFPRSMLPAFISLLQTTPGLTLLLANLKRQRLQASIILSTLFILNAVEGDRYAQV